MMQDNQDKHILIIRPGAIGDSLLTFPIMHTLKATRHAHITFVSNAAVLPLAQAWHVADAVDDYSDPRWSALFADNGIQSPALHTLISTCDLILCWLRDAEGIVQRNLSAITNRGIIIAPGRPSEGEHIHIVDYLAQTANENVHSRGGGGADVGWRPLWSPVVPSHTTIPHTSIAIHPGSGGKHKCWPVPSFAALIQHLWQQSIPVLLLGGPADHERIETLRQSLPIPPTNTLIDAPLLEVAETLRMCRGYVGNDSGITHLAAMTGIPTIALFGPSDPTVWRPLGSKVTVLYEKSLENLPVERVLQAIL